MRHIHLGACHGVGPSGLLFACLLCALRCSVEEPLSIADGESTLPGAGGSGAAEPTSGGGPSEDPPGNLLPPGDKTLGNACDSDADCTSIYPTCASVGSGVWAPGGPSLGYCTRSCDLEEAAEGNDACANIDVNSACREVRPGGDAYCILGCNRGSVGNPTFKCQGRTELACATLDMETGAGECLPNCGISLDCQDGTECNIASGFCEPAPFTSALGQPCDPAAGEDTACPGWCYAVSEDAGFCTGRCTIGSQIACGFEQRPRDLVCALASDLSTDGGGLPLAGPGDLGLCLPACNCTEQCPQGASCLALSDTEAFFIGYLGLCVAPEEDPARAELSDCF